MDKRQSSNEARCIKILINKDKQNVSNITLSSQLDNESTIRILEQCLNNLKDKASQKK